MTDFYSQLRRDLRSAAEKEAIASSKDSARGGGVLLRAGLAAGALATVILVGAGSRSNDVEREAQPAKNKSGLPVEVTARYAIFRREPRPEDRLPELDPIYDVPRAGVARLALERGPYSMWLVADSSRLCELMVVTSGARDPSTGCRPLDQPIPSVLAGTRRDTHGTSLIAVVADGVTELRVDEPGTGERRITARSNAVLTSVTLPATVRWRDPDGNLQQQEVPRLQGNSPPG